MRKRVARASAVLAVLGLLAAAPGTAFASDGVTARVHLDGGKPIVLKVDL